MARPEETLVPSWVPFAGQLVNRLSAADQIPDPCWREVLHEVPRHHFIRRYYTPDPAGPGGWAIQRQAPEIVSTFWYRRIYTDTALVTDLTGADVWGVPRPAAIAPAPSALLRALAALHIHDGDRVLEMGTGCGWTAGLLTGRLGLGQVTTVEIDVEVHEQAAARLSELGLAPTLLRGDSTAADITAALRSGGLFDQILVAHGVDDIPRSWTRLLRPGGRLLARLEGGLGAGGYVLLTAHPDLRHPEQTASLSGPFLGWSDPVPSRRHGARSRCLRPPMPPPATSTATATTFFDPAQLDPAGPLALLCQLQLPTGTTHHTERVGLDRRSVSVVTTRDGAWAEIAHRSAPYGGHLARHNGSRALLDALETAQTVFRDHHKPRWDEFGITADAAGTRVWLYDPHTGPSWDLQPERPIGHSS